jgi:F420-dependent methylenetetrahydromethanopterin dehydrogenase
MGRAELIEIDGEFLPAEMYLFGAEEVRVLVKDGELRVV